MSEGCLPCIYIYLNLQCSSLRLEHYLCPHYYVKIKYKLPESLANHALPAGDQDEVNGQKSEEGDVGLGQGDACVEPVG